MTRTKAVTLISEFPSVPSIDSFYAYVHHYNPACLDLYKRGIIPSISTFQILPGNVIRIQVTFTKAEFRDDLSMCYTYIITQLQYAKQEVSQVKSKKRLRKKDADNESQSICHFFAAFYETLKEELQACTLELWLDCLDLLQSQDNQANFFRLPMTIPQITLVLTSVRPWSYFAKYTESGLPVKQFVHLPPNHIEVTEYAKGDLVKSMLLTLARPQIISEEHLDRLSSDVAFRYPILLSPDLNNSAAQQVLLNATQVLDREHPLFNVNVMHSLLTVHHHFMLFASCIASFTNATHDQKNFGNEGGKKRKRGPVTKRKQLAEKSDCTGLMDPVEGVTLPGSTHLASAVPVINEIKQTLRPRSASMDRILAIFYWILPHQLNDDDGSILDMPSPHSAHKIIYQLAQAGLILEGDRRGRQNTNKESIMTLGCSSEGPGLSNIGTDDVSSSTSPTRWTINVPWNIVKELARRVGLDLPMYIENII